MRLLQLNYRDPRPIYEQIKDGIRALLVSGALARDERLPSVRELAVQLAINPNTIQRAYRELESEGYIYSVPGTGSFAGGSGDIHSTRRAELLKQLDDAVKELKYLGVSGSMLRARITEGEKSDD